MCPNRDVGQESKKKREKAKMTSAFEKRMMKIKHITEDAVAHLIMVTMSNVLITIIRLYTTNYVACGGQLHHLRASFEQLELFNVPQ